jgi:hypothetical protein
MEGGLWNHVGVFVPPANIARQRLGKHVLAATNTQTATQELLNIAFLCSEREAGFLFAFFDFCSINVSNVALPEGQVGTVREPFKLPKCSVLRFRLPRFIFLSQELSVTSPISCASTLTTLIIIIIIIIIGITYKLWYSSFCRFNH